MNPEIWRGMLKGARIGFLAGLVLAALYLVLFALGDTDNDKSLAFTLLLVGFPVFFAVVFVLQWLGLHGGSVWVGMILFLLTLTLNGTLWGGVIGLGRTAGILIARRSLTS